MNCTQSVPSRELCEELARLGICQDEPELWYSKDEYIYCEDEYYCDNNVPTKEVVAPTLPRLMSELPYGYDIAKLKNGTWHIMEISGYINGDTFDGEISSIADDKHLPNAIAKALIAMKKG